MAVKTTEKTDFTLDRLSPGQSGVIRTVGNDKGPVKRRLVDMGLTPGVKVTLRKVAPFGDPLELTLRGYELSLRKEDAKYITLCDPAAAPAAPA